MPRTNGLQVFHRRYGLFCGENKSTGIDGWKCWVDFFTLLWNCDLRSFVCMTSHAVQCPQAGKQALETLTNKFDGNCVLACCSSKPDPLSQLRHKMGLRSFVCMTSHAVQCPQAGKQALETLYIYILIDLTIDQPFISH